MADKLLVRGYKVGVGDCIYVRIPNGADGFHMLIDCGTIGSITLLEKAVRHIKENLLPDSTIPGNKRLDLLVATHRHKDHIKGFDPKFFTNIQIKNIWLSAVMNPEHQQSAQTLALHEMATKKMRSLDALNLSLSPQLQQLMSMFSLDNDDAIRALREQIPDENHISPEYVHAGMESNDLNLQLDDATIKVLAPENDIDGFYLGKEFDESLKGFQNGTAFFDNHSISDGIDHPENISLSDFLRLKSRMLSNEFAFAETDSSLQNNCSVVLLISWRGRRLLFTGDAEWERAYEDGKHNGSWNVMWKMRHDDLDGKLDFIKIGHHGSQNATPWIDGGNQKLEVNQIFNAILPLSDGLSQCIAQAIISTERTNVYETIPSPDLLVELGKRVKNTRDYYSALAAIDQDFYKKEPFKDLWNYEREDMLKVQQPYRTDLENMISGKGYVDVEIESVD
ncbi:MAG: hypothetical protein WAV05_10840 [Anaerolineales bacterium]